jgi:hypothetical protein
MTDRLGRLPFPLIALLAAGLLLGGCGDDKKKEEETPEDQVEGELDDLEGFATGATNSTEGQLLQAPAVTQLLSRLGLGFPGGGLLPVDPRDIVSDRASFARSTGFRPAAVLGGYGTYDRVPASTSPPFPGWALADTLPNDGYVFRFGTDDDIAVDNGTRHLGGEVRFLDIIVDAGGTPEDPSDDILTRVRFEIQIIGVTPDPVVKIAYLLTLDQARKWESLEIGDPDDLGSSYLGLIAIALAYSTPNDDWELFLQLVDQEPNPNFVIRLDIGATDITADIPTEVTFTFGYGDTDDASSPPWEVTATLDNFRPGTGADEWVADIQGSITYNERTLATFEGDTTEVPDRVDTDGDGDVDDDDTCVNIDITFVGSNEPVNVCEALADVIDISELPIPGGDGGFRLLPYIH